MADDILILGLSKTGTTAISQAIWRSLGAQHTLHQEPTTFGQADGKSKPADWHLRRCGRRGVVTKCLIFPELDPAAWDQLEEVAGHYSHRIWIDRDPRDRLISHTLYGWYRGHGRRIADRAERQLWERKFEQTLVQVQRKEAEAASVNFCDLLTGWWQEGYRERFAAEQGELYRHLVQRRAQLARDWHLLRYEDFIDGELRSLGDYLGVAVSNEITVKLRQKRVARSRTHGDWRHWFTSADVAFLRPLYRDYLALAGYDPDDWRLAEPQVIEPAHGSGYLKKIHGPFAF